ARLDDQLHRTSGTGRPASCALRRDRRARSCDSRYRLRLRDLRAVGPPGRAGDCLGQAQGDGRGRAAGVKTTLEIVRFPDAPFSLDGETSDDDTFSEPEGSPACLLVGILRPQPLCQPGQNLPRSTVAVNTWAAMRPSMAPVPKRCPSASVATSVASWRRDASRASISFLSGVP